ncbi:hypothetical protein JW721_04180 [Candidatus Micrarchaeota archaeon]|nr:hypothetical protein [Candidatus Micrarchaeota archaeon]
MNRLLIVLGMMLVLSFGCIQGGEGEAGASSGEWGSGEVSESGNAEAPENETGDEPAGEGETAPQEAGNESAECGTEAAPESEGNESSAGGEEGEGAPEAASGQQGEEGIISLAEAQQIALASPCIDEGDVLIENYTYNNYTQTWWFETNITKPGCMPACVVDEETLSAEINWRCTGLIMD